MKKFWKIGIVILGGLLGYGYYYYIGCRSGMCPITSNPWISTGYGALIGFVLILGKKSDKTTQQSKEN
ncbi:hypothetical protein GF337_05235 [candidate division KSB1 bacterium]|nr:hypothetical protein [candidate division KSB1 bacterium]